MAAKLDVQQFSYDENCELVELYISCLLNSGGYSVVPLLDYLHEQSKSHYKTFSLSGCEIVDTLSYELTSMIFPHHCTAPYINRVMELLDGRYRYFQLDYRAFVDLNAEERLNKFLEVCRL